ncbi:MAG: DUF3383 domain-containing protein [Proteobacteria bacterium]|nr:DUF3383 domain-containing protein [Pseudomonadota bacterium]
MLVSEVASMTVGLSAAPGSISNFGVSMLLVDHADIPLDTRYVQTTKDTYATDLTTGSPAAAWCATLWGQTYNPAQAYIVRWVSAASSPYFVAVQTDVLATWTAITDGCCTVTSTGGADILTGLNFSSCTDMDDVALVFNTAIVAGGNSDVLCTYDTQDRLLFTDAGRTGAGANTVVISASGSGTHVELAAYLNVTAGWQVGGADIEAQSTAMNACLALDNTPYVIHEIGGSVAQVTALSTAVNALQKIGHFKVNDLTAKTSGTADLPYAINALSHNRSWCCYSEHYTGNGAAATQYPDACPSGEIMPRTEATTNYALTPYSGVSQSGLGTDKTSVIALTVGERTYLEGKGCDYLVKPSTLTHTKTGLSVGGREMRVQIGMDFFAAKVAEDVYAWMVATPVVTYSDSDLAVVKGIILKWANEMADRKLLDDTTFDFSNFPSASDFSAAVKATHVATLSNVFSVTVLSSINNFVMSVDFTI